ncbi:MAG: acyltransferase [Chitinophagaceae bacterium]|nr:acyltransferase [Chitinophagaceae bacterium]
MSQSTEVVSAKKEKIFFPNLDGLRFFSFIIVFFSHIFATQYDYIKEEGWYQVFKGRLFGDGDMGVSFFFVLSGFLITYLLIKEKQLTGKVHISSFYIRRTLRIWPLYYFCVLFGFIAFPVLKSAFGQVPNETADPFLCSIFLNNFNAIYNGPPDSSILSVLWSVAIEEQFYLLWPILFYLASPKQYKFIFLGVIIISIIYRTVYINQALDLLTLGVISDMAIGGLGAYLSIASISFLLKMEKIPGWVHLIPYIVTGFLIYYRKDLFHNGNMIMTVFQRLIVSFFFIWIILEQNFSKRSLFKISNLKTISKLGKYTYGLYCLHTLALLVVATGLAKLGINKHSWQLWLIELPVALALSIFLSYISYHYFEKRFLKLKDRFAFIVKE